MTSYPLESSAQTIADATGAGNVEFTPPVNQTWQVNLVTVTSLGGVCEVIRNGVVVIDSTSGDPRPQATSDSAYSLHPSEKLSMVWTGMQPGAQLTATLHGTVELS